MGIISNLKYVLKRSLSVDQVKQHTQSVKNLASDMFQKEEPRQKETFEDAMARLNLTEDDIQRRSKELQRLFIVYCFILFGLLIYLIYVISRKAWIATLGTFGISLAVIAQIFRYHFWLFQIRQKRLGCTFKDWIRTIFNKVGRGNSSVHKDTEDPENTVNRENTVNKENENKEKSNV